MYLLVGLASVFIILVGINLASFLLSPILLAMMITIAVIPVTGWFRNKGLPGWLSLLFTILVVVGVLGLVIFVVIFSLGKLTAELPTYLSDMASRQEEDASSQTSYSSLSAQASDLVSSEFAGQILRTMITFVAPIIFQMVLVLFIFVFMVSAVITLPARTRGLIDPDLPMVSRVNKFTNDIQRYLSVMTVINILVGLGDAILLWILGVDFALLWGILAWFLGYIPSIGFWIAMIPPVILAYVQYGFETALIVFVGYVLINGSVQNIIQPKMMGERLSISPLIVFVSLFVWAGVLGGIGALLAVPLTLMVLTVLEMFEPTRWLVVLVRASPAHEDGERAEAVGRLREMWERVRPRSEKLVEPE
jgi:predicted PurR-regulated permease PerM